MPLSIHNFVAIWLQVCVSGEQLVLHNITQYGA